MPPRILRDVLVVDRSPLACNMYHLLFTAQNRFRVRFADEFRSLFKKSKRLKPDLLVINSNALPQGDPVEFPAPAILIASESRLDLKEAANGIRNLVLVEKPFYPYDLVSVANRLITQGKGGGRGRKRGKRA